MSKAERTEVKDLFKNLKSTIEKDATPPVQTVMAASPRRKAEKGRETIFSFYIEPERLKALRLRSVNDGTPIKELISNAIFNQYGI